MTVIPHSQLAVTLETSAGSQWILVGLHRQRVQHRLHLKIGTLKRASVYTLKRKKKTKQNKTARTEPISEEKRAQLWTFF